jgi:hypothetical protein
MDNRDPVWSFGESQLLYDSTSGFDVTWWFGESFLLDDREVAAPGGVGSSVMGGSIMRGIIMGGFVVR